MTPPERPHAETHPQHAPVHFRPGLGGLIRHPTAVFLYSGLLFLFAAFVLFLLLGWVLYETASARELMQIAVPSGEHDVSQRDLYNFWGRILSVMLMPGLLALSGLVCTAVGIGLLRAAGVVTRHVIPSHEYELLAPAIREGNEKAINEYIRLSSLSGITGTFTKIGLTGLPLATIGLTVVLALFGVFNDKFFDLCQLTLGAFIGSYVQRRNEGGSVLGDKSVHAHASQPGAKAEH